MSTPRSSQLRAQIEGELHRLQVGPRFPPDLTVYVQLLRDVLTLLDAEPEQGWQEPNCSCGHSKMSHPFGLSENLVFNGTCQLCSCAGFLPRPSSPAAEEK